MWKSVLILSLFVGTSISQSYILYRLQENQQNNPRNMPNTLSKFNQDYADWRNDVDSYSITDPIITNDVAEWRNKKSGPTSLSVVNPIEVLRNRLMLEIARRKMQKQDESQLMANRQFLRQVGKRYGSSKKINSYYSNPDSAENEWNNSL